VIYLGTPDNVGHDKNNTIGYFAHSDCSAIDNSPSLGFDNPEGDATLAIVLG
jgi:hypothetical protein